MCRVLLCLQAPLQQAPLQQLPPLQQERAQEVQSAQEPQRAQEAVMLEFNLYVLYFLNMLLV
jgi:hypothetical protein